jgi:hypothetical protein
MTYQNPLVYSRVPSYLGEGIAVARAHFERDVEFLEQLVGTTANGGFQFAYNTELRFAYQRKAREFAQDLRNQAQRGSITWQQAATEANRVRNEVMYAIRAQNTAPFRAYAESLKREGKTLNDLIQEKTLKRYGHPNFHLLAEAQKGEIYKQIVESAAKSNSGVNLTAQRLSYVGRTLIIISVAIAVYNVTTTENKSAAAAKEASIIGGGIGGGVVGGGVAGLACGPGAPVCVGIGAFVGGVLGAFGVSLFW